MSDFNFDEIEDFDEFDEFDEEFDLIKLIATNADDSNQFLVFNGASDEYYGINIAKVEEILVFDEHNISKSSDQNSLISGTSDIRGHMTSVVYFDRWMLEDIADDSEYDLLILTNFGGYKVGIVVKNVYNIVTIESSNMHNNSTDNSKSSFITKIEIKGESQMCTIFDSDKMLFDLFGFDEYKVEKKEMISSKKILFTDDSLFIRTRMQKLFDDLGVNYEMFSDGLELLDYLNSSSDSDIGLIITDIELPKLNGRELVLKIREEHKWEDIKIIIYSNMINEHIKDTLLSIGANDIIEKRDLKSLHLAINELIR
jgi:two-component system chemotaxis response regulator CheV